MVVISGSHALRYFDYSIYREFDLVQGANNVVVVVIIVVVMRYFGTF